MSFSHLFPPNVVNINPLQMNPAERSILMAMMATHFDIKTFEAKYTFPVHLRHPQTNQGITGVRSSADFTRITFPGKSNLIFLYVVTPSGQRKEIVLDPKEAFTAQCIPATLVTK